VKCPSPIARGRGKTAHRSSACLPLHSLVSLQKAMLCWREGGQEAVLHVPGWMLRPPPGRYRADKLATLITTPLLSLAVSVVPIMSDNPEATGTPPTEPPPPATSAPARIQRGLQPGEGGFPLNHSDRQWQSKRQPSLICLTTAASALFSCVDVDDPPLPCAPGQARRVGASFHVFCGVVLRTQLSLYLFLKVDGRLHTKSRCLCRYYLLENYPTIPLYIHDRMRPLLDTCSYVVTEPPNQAEIQRV